MKKSVVAVIAVAVLSVAACGSGASVTEAPKVDTPAAPTEAEPTEAEPPAETERPPTETEEPRAVETATPAAPTDDVEPPEEPDPGNPFGDPVGADTESASFDDVARWDNGVEVSISEPEEYERGDTAVGGEGFDRAVIFTATVTNNGTETFEPAFFFTTAVVDGNEGEQVFDYGDGLELSPLSIGPGEAVDFKIAHGVDDGEVSVSVSPDFEYAEVTFSK